MSAAKSIVNISPLLMLADVETIITLSKWTIEQFGLQLCPNLKKSGQIPKA